MIDLRLGDCLEVMKTIADNSVDLVITSPPYDNLRSYKGFLFNYSDVGKELFRVIKQKGVMVWVVGDAVEDNSETCMSFRQAIEFREIGFNLHDTMIYQKNSYPYPMSNRYYQVFEYMFVFSKGIPKTANLLKQPTIWKQKNKTSSTTRQKDGTTTHLKYETGKDERTRDNVWKYNCGYMRSSKDKISFEHPATFPEQLGLDHILSWSNEGDTVLDPMAGSGTTLKMAKLLGRNFIGIEISERYCQIARDRLRQQLLL